MKTKAPNPAITISKNNIHPLIPAYFEFVHLKHLYRQGWLARGIPEVRCESVAEHSFGVALVAMILAEADFPELDLQKVLRMALIHDIGEVYAGDIIPNSGIAPEEKHGREKESLQRVFEGLPQAEEYLRLWEEFENGTSPEALFIRQIDKLEMALQASVYEHQQLGDLSDFYASAGKTISTPVLRAILQELENLK